MTTIMIVDDQEGMRQSLAMLLRKEGYDVITVADGHAAMDIVRTDCPKILISDVRMQPMSGLELLKAAKSCSAAVEVIMMTAFATVEAAVEAMKLGAFDYITKPFKSDEVLLRIRRALEVRDLEDEIAMLRNRFTGEAAGLVGGSAAMRQVLNRIATLGPTDLTVLLTGETGTGKTAVARAIHEASRRRAGPFIHVNCAALPDTLLEAELFGHEKGAFTGALGARRGLFEEAIHGTIFLDEVALLPLGLQSKLLTVLEDGVIRRVGSNKALPIDARIVAATNANLKAMLDSGQLRHDLYFRINVAQIFMPPLRDRPEDIPALLMHFLSVLEEKYRRNLRISNEALQLMSAYSFPGNVRELSNILSIAYTLATPPLIMPKDFPEEVRAVGAVARGEAGPTPSRVSDLAAIERQAIERTITQNQGNLTKAAKALGIGRTTLWRRLKRDQDTAGGEF